MILLASTTSEFLQTILCLPNEYTSSGAKWESVPGALYLKKKRLVYIVKQKESTGLNFNKSHF